MGASYQRTIAAEVSELEQLLRELVGFFEAHGVPAKAGHDAQVVCEELVVNAIRHGVGRLGGGGGSSRSGAGAQHRIDVTVDLGDAIGDAIAIRIRDDLPSFDPTVLPLPAPVKSIAAAPIGGRGIAMVRQLTSRFQWHADERGRNVVEAEMVMGRRG